MSQTESIDALFRAIDEISSEARSKRLELDKLVKARKLAIREEIVFKAQAALRAHVDQITASFDGRARLPQITADFGGSIKGKKTVASVRDAADSELARAKIDASHIGDSIRANLKSLDELAGSHMFLFNDIQQLVSKANEDLVALIKVRIDEHQKAEEAHLEKQREQIRQEEAQKLADEAAAKAAEESKAVQTAPAPAQIPAAQPARRVAAVAVPTKTAVSKPVSYQAQVKDLAALVAAVAEGRAPISVLTVNWEALDNLVKIQGAEFSIDGVVLEQVAA